MNSAPSGLSCRGQPTPELGTSGQVVQPNKGPSLVQMKLKVSTDRERPIYVAFMEHVDFLGADPDDSIAVPVRELAAMLELLRASASLIDADPALGQRLADVVALADGDVAALLEAGIPDDAEGMRLFLHMLHTRLRRCAGVATGVLPPPPVTLPASESLPTRRASRSAAVFDDDLSEYFAWWDDITPADVAAYEQVLEAASDEHPLQTFLARNPRFLVQHLGGGAGRWVIPQKRLGAEYVPDFVIGERSSSGFGWQFVELQSPKASLFVKSTGRQSKQLDEGLRQINDWRRWLDNNRDYARRPRARDGLGLDNASGSDPGLLIIGREADLTETDRERRRQLDQQHNVRIHTYDWLVRAAKGRLAALNR